MWAGAKSPFPYDVRLSSTMPQIDQDAVEPEIRTEAEVTVTP